MCVVDFINSFKSEWLKRKRSLGSWLIVVASLFTPTIVVVVRLLHHNELPRMFAMANFWTSHWRSSWESMAIFFLPMGAILTTSLVVQIEYRNNSWKQVHTLPLSPAIVFFAKYAVIILMMAQFFLLFIVAVYLSAIIPSIVLRSVPFPVAHFALKLFLTDTGNYMVASLPIVAAQYLLSLRFSNFLIAVGAGFMAWVGALAALSWKFGYLIPYGYTMLHYLRDDPKGRIVVPAQQLNWLAIGYAVLFTSVGFWLFVKKRQKG